jgi:pyrroloquinoline quinone biosynthesis protein B
VLRICSPLLLGLALSCSSAPSTLQESGGSGVLVLGVAQDGGRPQLGCRKACCADLPAANAEPVASLAVFGESSWALLDATPDLPEQIAAVGSLPAAIVLTHAHIGHYLGLAHLGREVMGADHVPVWCSERMASFLRSSGPWSQLVEVGNIELMVFEDGVAFSPLAGVTITPLAVPHRDEYSDTFGFSISVHGAGVLYIPDIDGWEEWGELPKVAAQHDVALLDATFFEDGELPGRDMSDIPHPRVPETMKLLAPLVESGELRVWFTHLNHTNPLWRQDSVEAQRVVKAGFGVAELGMWVVPRK